MENILINIDSRFRNKNIYPNSGNFSFKLSEKIKDVMYIRMSSVELPNLYFVFSKAKNNTTFVITVDTVDFEINIQDGFYNSTQLLRNIQDKLTSVPGHMNIKLNLANGYVTLESTVTFSVNFTNTGKYPSLGYQLGFRNNIYTSVVENETKQYIKSESQLDRIGDNYVFIRVNDYGKIYNFTNLNNVNINENMNNYLAKVIMNVNKTEHNFDNNNFLTKKYIFRQPTNITKFDIELLDPLGNIIDMVQMDFSFTLEIGVIYDKCVYEKYLKTIDYQMMFNGLLTQN
jgi:hypothetical protein